MAISCTETKQVELACFSVISFHSSKVLHEKSLYCKYRNFRWSKISVVSLKRPFGGDLISVYLISVYLISVYCLRLLLISTVQYTCKYCSSTLIARTVARSPRSRARVTSAVLPRVHSNVLRRSFSLYTLLLYTVQYVSFVLAQERLQAFS